MRYLIFCLLICLGCVNLQAQTADFSTDPTPSTLCAPVQVQCTDLSTGATSWNWTVTGPEPITPSTDQFPGFTFITPGVYTITLSINGGVSTHVENVTVFQIPEVHIALAPGSTPSGCAPFDVCFEDQTIPGDGAITDWSWDLGVPPASPVQDPCFTYIDKNTVDVELVVTDANGCQAFAEEVNFIQIFDPPTPIFTIDPSSGCEVPLDVTVTNTTFAQPGTVYSWDFPGPGVNPPTFTGQDPGVVVYNQNGTYDIQLITSDNGCNDTLLLVDAVSIDVLIANFLVSDDMPCQNETITFTDDSNLSGLDYQWLVNGTPVGLNQSDHSVSFPNIGVQQVGMIATTQDGICSDTIYQTVDVQPGPTVDFSAPITSSCGAPFTANFTSAAPGAASYFWSVSPSGGVSIASNTSANPDITFNSPGSYTITLTVASANGCTNTISKPNYIRINENININITSNVAGNEGCVPLDIEFNLSGNLPPGVSYNTIAWDLTGGSPASGSGIPITTTYNSLGDYVVTADVTFTGGGGCASTTVIAQVEVGDFPTLTASITPLDICLNESVVGSATSNLPGTEFSWYFEPPGGYVNGGIGTTSSGPYTYENEYQQPWEVLLVGDNNGCKDTVIIPVNVNPPAAQYDWSRSCDPRTEVTFDANEAQGVFGDSVAWFVNYDFSNPIYYADDINDADFTYDFGVIDVYSVTLIVGSSFTGCLDSQTYVIDLLNAQPNASITPRSLCPGESVSFFDNTQGLDTWQWYFGDGDTSSIAGNPNNFQHNYDESGIYNTYLFTQDQIGCRDTLGPVPIYVGGGHADVGGILGACFPPLTTTFNTTGSVFEFGVAGANWIIDTDPPGPDFVNGPLTAGPYTYNTNGNYNVFVEVYDTIGCTDDTSVIVNVGDVVADFSADITSICPGQDVFFNNNSLGGNLSYSWDFGDGSGTSTEAEPTYDFPTTGQFTVTLTITDTIGGCSDTEVKPLYINAVGTGFDFTSSLPRVANCPPLFVSFDMVPAVNPDQLDYVGWYFEESDEIVYEGDELTGSTTGQNFYLQGGPDGNGWYDVILVVEVGGCRDSIYKDDYIFVGGQRGSFTFTPDTICAPDDILFSQVNVDRTDSIFWDFGGGAFLNAGVGIDNIQVNYDEPGVYEPVILLRNADCPPVAVDPGKKLYVSDILADGLVDKTFLCDGGNVVFRDSSTVPADTATGDFISSIVWNFGDGSPNGTGSNPTHNYNGTFGDLTITLTTTTDFGCQDDTTFNLSIYETPDGVVGPPATICIGESVELSASGADNYEWSPPAYVIDNTSDMPTVIPDDTTDFIVLMYNNILCPDIDTVRVNVLTRIDGVVGPDQEICIGQSVQLEAIPLVTSLNGVTTYTWIPSTGLSNPNIADPIASPTETIIYTVTIASGSCEPDQANVLIEVGGTPFVDAGPDQVIAQGETAELTAFSPNIVTYYWTDIDDNFISNDQTIFVNPSSSTSYIVEVGNDACRDIDTVDILILEDCEEGRVRVPNIFTPNNDGVNDEFHVRPGLGVAEISTFKIFNRWGELVFNANSESVNWDGTHNGSELDPGVYVYYIDLICTNGQKSIRKGNITLLK